MTYEYPLPCDIHTEAQIVGKPVLGYYILRAAYEGVCARHKVKGMPSFRRDYFDVGYRFVKKIDVTKVELVLDSVSGMPIDPRVPYSDFRVSGRFYYLHGKNTILEQAARIFVEDTLERIEPLLRLKPPPLERRVCIWDYWHSSVQRVLVTATPVNNSDGKLWECPNHGYLPFKHTEVQLDDQLFAS